MDLALIAHPGVQEAGADTYQGLSTLLPLHPARSEVLGTCPPGHKTPPPPFLTVHKARDPLGISGEMPSAKPPGLQGPDRKPPSFPCGLPAPTHTDPRAGSWSLGQSGGSEVRLLPGVQSSLALG